MPIYIVVPLTETSTALDEAVEKRISPPTDRYRLPSNRGWFIKFDGTTIELSNHLELTGQEKGVPSPIGQAIVAPVNSYYGRGPMDMWEWLKIRFENE